MEAESLELTERVVSISRVSKVVKGGKIFRLRAVVVVGDGNGWVGFGIGKSREVPEAIRKAVESAKKSVFHVPIKGTTIPHQTFAKFRAGKVLLKPAAPGTGVIAGGAVRAVVESVGIKDILTKSMGSENALNIVSATIAALKTLKSEDDVIKSRKGDNAKEEVQT